MRSSSSHASDRTLVEPHARTNTMSSHLAERVRTATNSRQYQVQPPSSLPLRGRRRSGSAERGTSTVTLIGNESTFCILRSAVGTLGVLL